MAYVYILRCADDSYYVGLTHNLETRVAQHREGIGSSYTSKRRPVALVYWERLASRRAATNRERQLKRWTRQKKEALISGDLFLRKASQ